MKKINNKIVLNFIQDIATPHNNVLIAALKNHENVELKLWYAKENNDKLYQWDKNITHEHLDAKIYGNHINWKFLFYCIAKREEKFLIVGWMNINTKLLHLLFFLFRRPFNHWTDLPDYQYKNQSVKKSIKNKISNFILKNSICKIFGVGKITLDYFSILGFSKSNLVNLPIFVNTEEDLENYKLRRAQINSKYSTNNQTFLIVAGSRLIFDKGYDLLLEAFRIIPLNKRINMKLVIVGSGVEKKAIEKLIETYDLSENTVIEPWLSIEDFKLLIANGDVFIHPARFDSFGGTTLAMAMGKPVIGSYTAGAAYDRIIDGHNGYLYDSKDVSKLAEYIILLYDDNDLKIRLGENALMTAKEWSPLKGADILAKNLI
jgi:glycosyltransferase involved in cell wall biosynthesis